MQACTSSRHITVPTAELPFKRHYNAVMAKGERVIAASRFIAELMWRIIVYPTRIRVIHAASVPP